MTKTGFQIEISANELDLVCGMELSQKIKYKLLYNKKFYYFCSKNCKEHFQNDPEKYIG